MAVHEVENQPQPLADVDLYTTDQDLGEAVRREGAGWAEAELAVQADRRPPVLLAFGARRVGARTSGGPPGSSC